MIEEVTGRGGRFLSVRPVTRNVEAISFFYDAGFGLVGHLDMFMELAKPTERQWRPGIAIHGRHFEY
jgi:hypothetical protein